LSLCSKPLSKYLFWLHLSAPLQQARRVFGLALVGLLSLWLRFDLL